MSLVLDSTDHEHYRTGYIAAVDHRRSSRGSSWQAVGQGPRVQGCAMIDPMSGVVDLEQAVARLAADISDQEVDEEQRRRKKDAATLSFSGLHWVKREMAITRLYVAFCNGSLIAVVRDRVSGALFRLISTDWKEAAFWRETIVGGVVRAQTGEELALYEGRRVLLEAGAFDAWRNTQMRRRSQPAKAACQEWLEAAMREAPTRGSKPKREWRKEAKTKFNVSGRAFDQIWAAALPSTGADWDRHGAPPKLRR
jgi:hypothetical protein